MREYWAYTWLDDRGIRGMEQLNASLESNDTVEELKELAGAIIEAWKVAVRVPRPDSLIAGAGIDLSGRLDCNATSCRRAQVERLFQRTWHYFETVVARDAIAEDLVSHRNCPFDELRQRLAPHFETLLIVREYGAEPLVEFMPRVPACFQHWRQHAGEAGIEDVADNEKSIVNDLVKDTEVSFSRDDDIVTCILNNRLFSHTQWVDFKQSDIKGQNERKLKLRALQQVVRDFLVNLTADANAAKRYGGTLGSSIPMFQKLLSTRGKQIANVAFELELPVLDGLTTQQLIEVRLRYADSFSRFRKRLDTFVQQCVSEGITTAGEVRARAKRDLIDGELRELQSDLQKAKKSIALKATYALTMGTLVAVIGLTTGIITPAVSYGLGASLSAASASPGVSRFIDDLTQIRADDLYFLVQAEKHAH